MKTAQLKKVIKKYFRRYHKNIKGNSLPKFSQGLRQQRFFKSHCSNPIFYKVEAQRKEWATQPKMSKEGIREELTLQPRLEEYTDKPAKWIKDLEEQNKRIRKKVKSLSHVRLCDSMDCSLSGSSTHGVFQARILEWVAISFSKESSQPRDQTGVSCISCIGRWILYLWASWEVWWLSFDHFIIKKFSIIHSKHQQ